jgi:sugar phosphate isomerase/epimerase
MLFGLVHHSLGHGIPVEQAIRTAYEHGALVFATGVNHQNRDLIRDLMAQYNMRIVAGWGDNYIANGENQTTENFERICREVWEPLGIRVIGTASSHHRWRKDPPLDVQLTQLVGAFRKLCPVAADYNVTIAIENHADYRSGDILSVLERVDHSSLRVQLDTGNPYAVAEEPLDAVRQLAPFAASTHIKDMTIRPLTDGQWVKVLGCPIGEGDVDMVQVAKLLTELAPKDLPFNLEVEPPPGTDMTVACPNSVAYVKRELSEFLEFQPSS